MGEMHSHHCAIPIPLNPSRAFLHDITAATLVFQHLYREMGAILILILQDLNSFKTLNSFVPVNLYSCWPHE